MRRRSPPRGPADLVRAWLALGLDLAWVGLCIVSRALATSAVDAGRTAATVAPGVAARGAVRLVRGVVAFTFDVIDAVVTIPSATVEAAVAVAQAITQLAGPPLRVAGRHAAAAARYARRRIAPRVTVAGLLASAALEVRGRGAARHAHKPLGAIVRKLPALGAASLVVVLAATQLPNPTLRWAAHFVEDDVSEKGFAPLAQRSTIVAADGSPIAVLHGRFDRQVVPYDRIPQPVVRLVLAAEDREFWRHHGYDLGSMTRALMADVRAGGVVQGGSTITQQLAKQNFVGNQQTVLRKGKEVLYAVALEQTFPKRQLLERYLNQVYFGAGAYGVSAAAQEFFGVPVERLTVAEGALLAGLIHSPSALNPRRHPAAARQRRDEVLRAAARQHLLTRQQVDGALHQPLRVIPPPVPPPDTPLVETIKRAFLSNNVFGRTRQARVTKLFRGGLRIETTLDPRLQAEAERIVRRRFADPNGPTAALASLDPRSGAVRALFGGTDQRFDLAAQGHRQPGSSFKPFAALAALEAGIPPTIQLPGNGPITLDYGGPDKWTVDNYEGESRGRVDLREALVHSVNTAFATLAVQVGADHVVDVVRRFGFDVDRDLGPPNARGPAVALGGLARGVSPLEMASAYGTFATDGEHREPFLINRVLDAEGHVIYQHDTPPRRVANADQTAQVVSILQDVVRRGTGTQAQLPGWEPLGKTGTTQDSADAWYVGSVPTLATAVWVGHATGRVPMPRATGGTVVAPLWRDFMTVALAGVTPEPFPFAIPSSTRAPAPSGSRASLTVRDGIPSLNVRDKPGRGRKG